MNANTVISLLGEQIAPNTLIAVMYCGFMGILTTMLIKTKPSAQRR